MTVWERMYTLEHALTFQSAGFVRMKACPAHSRWVGGWVGGLCSRTFLHRLVHPAKQVQVPAHSAMQFGTSESRMRDRSCVLQVNAHCSRRTCGTSPTAFHQTVQSSQC